jgi:hypothetical protein
MAVFLSPLHLFSTFFSFSSFSDVGLWTEPKLMTRLGDTDLEHCYILNLWNGHILLQR